MMISKDSAVESIRTEYRRLDCITGVDTSKVAIKISTRMTSKLGCFTAKKDKIFKEPKLTVTISDKILDKEDVFTDVIRHEYAHAAVYLRHPKENHNHDAVWKNTCLEVGCIPKATRKDVGSWEVKEKPYRYRLICTSCGAESKYKVESRVIRIAEGKNHGQIVCKRCGSTSFTLKNIKPIINTTLCYIEYDEKYLLLYRNKKVDDINEDKWIGIGGKIEPGESPDECMLREVYEETGIKLTSYHFHGIIHFRSDKVDEEMYLYSAKLAEEPKLSDCQEGKLSWINKDKILSLQLWEGDKLFLPKLLAGDDRIEMLLRYEGDCLVESEDYE